MSQLVGGRIVDCRQIFSILGQKVFYIRAIIETDGAA